MALGADRVSLYPQYAEARGGGDDRPRRVQIAPADPEAIEEARQALRHLCAYHEICRRLQVDLPDLLAMLAREDD